MKKIFVVILTIVVSLFTLSGCWSRREPKKLAIISSILYDLNEENKHKVVMELLHPTAIAGDTEKSPVVIVDVLGDSFPEAIRNATVNLERRLYGGNNKVRVLSEKLARTDVEAIMDFYLRDTTVDERPIMIVFKGEKPERLFDVSLGLSSVLGDYVDELAKNQLRTTAKAVDIEALEFMKDFYEEGIQPVMGCLEIVDNKGKAFGVPLSDDEKAKKKLLKYEGLAAFKKNKLVGFLDAEDAKVYNVLTNQAEYFYLTANAVNPASYRIVEVNTKKKIRLVNGKPVYDVDVYCRLSMLQLRSILDLGDLDVIKKLEKQFNEEFEKRINSTIKKTQEMKTDILGFGCEMHKKKPKIWRKYKKDWDDINYPNLEINVNVNSILSLVGEIEEPFGWSNESEKN